ncbi:hypothetical protein E4U21_006035 [Claviceps maximensis]|nr:hypothetical protein E4U21_006035 [Claviceps maximensis]
MNMASSRLPPSTVHSSARHRVWNDLDWSGAPQGLAVLAEQWLAVLDSGQPIAISRQPTVLTAGQDAQPVKQVLYLPEAGNEEFAYRVLAV